ncbi:hypothetical protein, partial [Nitrosomonas sp.]|uniref:hypothetical protein n=1 Tax=Nitrosomonas sp. TaxID=42353 RepID=UPI0037C747FD
ARFLPLTLTCQPVPNFWDGEFSLAFTHAKVRAIHTPEKEIAFPDIYECHHDSPFPFETEQGPASFYACVYEIFFRFKRK